MTVSIIIAVKTWQKNLEECVAKCRELDYPDFEIIVLPDEAPQTAVSGFVRVIPSGKANPAQKRDMAVAYAKGDILAFIDDDAYPRTDWLKNALTHFADPQIAAVGGPAVTPPSDDLRQKGSGLVYASCLVSGQYVYRYLPKKKAYVDDFPSCNFLVRKSIMQELGGFKTDFWPGEDTKICLDITKVLGKKIIYDPQVFVFHHRRRLFIPHLKQIENYALHRGYFVKKYPQTSLRLAYFLPSIFFLGILAAGVASLVFPALRQAYLLGVSLYLVIVLIFSFNKNPILVLYASLGTIFTHLAYGIYFLKGLLSSRMNEENKVPS